MAIISKQQLLTITLCLGIFLALGTVGAYTAPTTNPTGDNTEEPVLENVTSQAKSGNLSVYAFDVSLGSIFNQDTTFESIVAGGDETDTNSTLSFGDTTHETSIAVAGTLLTQKTFRSDSLRHSGPGLKPLCANAAGELFLCAGGGTPGPSCGNGSVESPEQCDDGGVVDGDGCSSSCSIEQSTYEIGGASASIGYDNGGNTIVTFGANLTGTATQDEYIALRYQFNDPFAFPEYHYFVIPTGQSSVYEEGRQVPSDYQVFDSCVESASLPIPDALKC